MTVRLRRHKPPWRLQQFLQLLALFDNTLMDVFPFDIGKLGCQQAAVPIDVILMCADPRASPGL
jgi:hypothetical protein